MGWLSACARAATIVAFAGFCAVSARAADPLPMLLGSPQIPAAGPNTALSVPAGPMVARARGVVVDFGVLDPRSATPPELGVELFDGVIVTLERVRIEARAPGNYTWYGRVRGFGRSDAVLTVVDGYIAGAIVVVDEGARTSATYELVSDPGGTVWLRQLDPAGFPPDHPSGGEAPAFAPQGSAGAAGGGTLQAPEDTDVAAADTGGTIDVMIVYTNETAAAAGSGIAAQIQQAVDRANLAYANSGVVPRLRLVHSAQVSYSEAGLTFNNLLDRLTSTGDSHMDEVHAWRNTYGADVVSLFIENGAYCGLGYLNSSATSAFTVVNRGCAGGNLSFAHEVGHNFGAHHDPAVATNTYYAYGHGYVYTPAKWRTVMAYDNACAGVGGCTRIAYFSNPDVSYGSPPAATGTATVNDNTRVHDERANAVANFRQAVTVAAPSVATAAATGVTTTGATLNGIVSSNGAATTVTFQYGPTTSYGNAVTAAQSPLAAGAANAAVSAAITGLACNTLQHFRVVGASTAGTTNGTDFTLTTAACPATPPTATTAAATGVTTTGATLNGTVSSNGASTAVTFQYGLTTSYGSTTTATQSPLAAGAAGAAVSAAIGGLACNTLHHFRVVGSSTGGTTNGADLTFTTAACSGTTATTTGLASNANPSAAGTPVAFTATVTGAAPTGSVAFREGATAIGGCAAVALVGSGNTRVATCTTGALAVGAHSIVASYGGNAGNAPSVSPALLQQVTSAPSITGIVVANPYGGITVQGGTLNGNVITLTSPAALIQFGGGTGAAGSFAQIDFQGLHVGPGNTLTIRSGAPGQVVVLRNVTAAASAIDGTLQGQGGNGAPPPELHVWNPNGIAIAPSGSVLSPSGLALDALDTGWLAGQILTNDGVVDGGPQLALLAANIRGGGAFRGNAVGVHTFGNANNPVNGAYYLQNGLQLYPSSGNTIALTINGYGTAQAGVQPVRERQRDRVDAVGVAGGREPAAEQRGRDARRCARLGVPEPAYGGGSMILQASGSLTLVNGGTNDFVFPGAIVLKAGGDLNVNGVAVDQGWTTSGQAFQGIFFEAPNIVSPNGLIRVYGNDLNWMNFSTLPQQYVRAFTLKRNPDGSASFAATDAITPHLNTYSLIQNTAASGGCWLCQVNTAPVNMYGP